MAEIFYLKQGDTAPILQAVLLEKDPSDNDVPADLAGATVYILVRKPGATVVLFRRLCTILDELEAVVEYQWQVGDTATRGRFRVEFEVTKANGKVQTHPNDGYAFLLVRRDLDAA